MSRELFLGNDWHEVVAITEEGTGDLYHSTAVVARITASDAADALAIGDLEVECAEVGETGTYVVEFDGEALDTDLAELPDGTRLYRVVESPGDIRIVRELTLRKVRRA